MTQLTLAVRQWRSALPIAFLAAAGMPLWHRNMHGASRVQNALIEHFLGTESAPNIAAARLLAQHTLQSTPQAVANTLLRTILLWVLFGAVLQVGAWAVRRPLPPALVLAAAGWGVIARIASAILLWLVDAVHVFTLGPILQQPRPTPAMWSLPLIETPLGFRLLHTLLSNGPPPLIASIASALGASSLPAVAMIGGAAYVLRHEGAMGDSHRTGWILLGWWLGSMGAMGFLTWVVRTSVAPSA